MNLNQVDPLTSLFDRIYLPEWTATEFTFASDWGLQIPSTIGCMYVFIRGGGWFLPEGRDAIPIRVEQGDHLITSCGIAHRMVRDLGSRTEGVETQLGCQAWFAPDDSESQSTRFIYGQFGLLASKANPLDIGLPEIIHLNHHRDSELAPCLPLLDLLHALRQSGDADWQTCVRRLAELVFIKTLRATMTKGFCVNLAPAVPSQIVRAAADSVVGPVLRAIVDQPAREWTIPRMARMAKTSKSSFSERFRNVVGQSPLQFVTAIRMQNACRLLRETQVDISQVGKLVGYDSPSSFSTAFRRWHFRSPVEYRRDGLAGVSPLIVA